MNDPFVSFDTFSIGEEAEHLLGSEASKPEPTPILARLPRIVVPARQETRKRFDDPQVAAQGIHHPEGAPLDPMAGGSQVLESPPRPISSNPFETIRIDTASPTEISDPTPKPELRVVSPPAESSVPVAMTEDTTAAWLLNLESAILPYSRVIVLAAVVAAMGLTVILLQGSGRPTSTESLELEPQVNAESSLQGLANTNETAPGWATSSEPTADLQPLPIPAAQPEANTIAAGPASAPRRTGQATLTGQIYPANSERINVADATNQPNYSQRTTR